MFKTKRTVPDVLGIFIYFISSIELLATTIPKPTAPCIPLGAIVLSAWFPARISILDKLGTVPLPPYIKTPLDDVSRYNTVYAKHDGSIATPTAGLHFTKELLQKIKNNGIHIAYLTLHVGIGTFRPVKVEDILEHKMHAEFYTLDSENAEIINNSKNK